MKQKISISIEDEVISRIEERLGDGLFRNKSHLIEYAVNKFLKS
jgi:Arc/MetJ-type ribon-helix-helix transcriptional regulator